MFRDHVPIGAGFSTPIDHQGSVVRPNNQTKGFWSAKPQVVEQLWFFVSLPGLPLKKKM